LKRLIFVVLASLIWVLSLSLVAAQETTETPTEAGTPAPLATPTKIPKPAPVNVLTQDNATLELYFPSIAQGQIGLAYVTGQGIAGARARFLNELIDFFPSGDGFYGVLSAPMEQSARTYELSVMISFADGTRATIDTQADVVVGSFIRQDIAIAPDKAFLLDPEIERNEIARLESVFSTYTPEKLWDDTGFMLPIIGGELTSPFGAFRTFNGSLQTRHTGWDVRAIMGVPIMASASGTVAYAGTLDIRGNHVVIDHGYGVFSTYSHLSQIHVTRGQSIVKGQIIGTTGDTGRSGGPHFHWEIAVNGEWVDSVQFMNTWMP
jgi:murein DD-endopeptidase MepM/ murein hydrolase activator NlpD